MSKIDEKEQKIKRNTKKRKNDKKKIVEENKCIVCGKEIKKGERLCTRCYNEIKKYND